MNNIKLQRENEILRKRVKELELRLEELLWDRFYECIIVENKKCGISKEDGWYLPTLSDQREACYELGEMGKIVKHDEMNWYKIKTCGE